MIDLMVSIGLRLKRERVRLGFNQSDFGAIGSVTKKTQCLYETGKRKPNAEFLAAIAAAGANVLYILTGKQTRNWQPTNFDVEILSLYHSLTAAAQQEIYTAMEEKRLLHQLMQQQKNPWP